MPYKNRMIGFCCHKGNRFLFRYFQSQSSVAADMEFERLYTKFYISENNAEHFFFRFFSLYIRTYDVQNIVSVSFNIDEISHIFYKE